VQTTGKNYKVKFQIVHFSNVLSSFAIIIIKQLTSTVTGPFD